VSLYKRLLLIAALVVVASAGFTATSNAQGYRGRRRVVVVGGYYSPYYFYDPFWYGPWFGSQWAYPPYPGGYLPPDASVRLEVKPNKAEVYVDGYYAGIVDDFDGAFQRLHVMPGEHELELYLDGYRAVKQKVYLTADNTFKVKYNLEKLGGGEQAEPRPTPPNPPPTAQGAPPMPPQGYPPAQQPPQRYPPSQPPRGPAGRRMPPPPPPGADPRGGQQDAYGSLAIRVQPNDAEVSIDGEAWRAPGGQERLVVEVAEGSHTVEIRKSGYRTYVTQVDVRRGATTPLNVSLRSEP
jgi:PEGA domain